MPLYHSNIPNLVNGVSQQADDLRFPSQVTSQINATSNPVNGLTKRPPSEYINTLYDTVSGELDNAFYHFIDRDANEKYLLIIHGGLTPQMDVFNVITGEAETVGDENGATLSSVQKEYLATSDARLNLEALTVGDNTFIVNKSVITDMDHTQVTEALVYEALVFCRTVNTGSTVTVELANTAGGAVDYSVSTTPAAGWDQHDVINAIHGALNSAGADSDYYYDHSDSVLYIRKQDLSDFNLYIGADNDGTTGIKGRAEALSDLPASAYTGFKVQIQGDPEDPDAEAYWAEYVPADETIADGNFASGFWEETVAPGIEFKIDASTMPHKLVSNGTDFRFSEIEYVDRLAGDEDTNEAPSFIGNTIQDLVYFKSRLGFISRENVILSKVGDFFNFFKSSAIQLIDDDRIDVAVGGSAQTVTFLRRAVPREKELVLFGDKAQFILSSEDNLFGPKTVSATLVSRNETSALTAQPIHIDNSIYYSFNRGDFAGIMEYIREDDFQPFVSINISEHIPRYLDGTITHMSGNGIQNTLIFLADGDERSYYEYKYLDKGAERVQSAWCKQQLDNAKIKFAFFDHTDLYLVVYFDDSSTDLLKIDTSYGANDGDFSFKIHLDRRMTNNTSGLSIGSYDLSSKTTSVTLPNPSSSTIQAVDENGELIPIDTQPLGGQVVLLEGDWTSSNFYIGHQYTMEQVLTRPMPFSPQDRKKLNNVTYMVKNGIIAYDDSMNFKVVVDSVSKTSYTYVYNSRDLGTLYSDVGEVLPLRDGDFTVPVYDNAIYVTVTLKNDTPFPCNLLNLTWEGEMRRRQ